MFGIVMRNLSLVSEYNEELSCDIKGNEMERAPCPTRIRFINDDDGTEISASSIRVELPNNLSFLMHSLPGNEQAVVFSIPDVELGGHSIRIFSILPGASNLFSVRIEEAITKYDT